MSKTYYHAQLIEQEMTEVNDTPAIILKSRLVAKDEKGKVVPIEPKEQSIWIFMPDRPNKMFSVEEQVDMLEDAILHHNPNWDGDYTDLGLTKFKVSSNEGSNGKTYWNLTGPGKSANTQSKEEASKAWAKFSRRAKKRVKANPAPRAEQDKPDNNPEPETPPFGDDPF